MPDFSFVTYSELPNLDPDDRLAVDILTQRGFSVTPVVWDDPAVAWSQAGICVIRSTWDYNLRHDQFLAWAEHVDAVTPLYNSLNLVRWNSHKRYLQDLCDRGIPIVPTSWLACGSNPSLEALMTERGWDRAVVKPGVGLSTHGVKLVAADRKGQEHVEALLREHDVMVQPYVPSVDSYGERALVFIDGTYSHAVRKTAFQPLRPAGESGETPAQASAAEIEVAVRAVGVLPEHPLYARVDVVHGDRGEPLVIELELVEPSLFLAMHPRAATRFADALTAVAARLTS